MDVQPYAINVPQPVLDDLQERLTHTRWAAEVTGVGWDYGTNAGYMQELTAYWQATYDWRRHEAVLNQFAQFRTELDGLGIHFIHERGKGPNPLPIILTHGWPDSFYRMYKIIPLLTDPARFGGDPADAFDVIVPSVPGFGFSDRPRKPGVGQEHTARLWSQLMGDVLGYGRFAAAGGDLGSGVTMHMAHHQPDRLVGIHLTDVSYPMSSPAELAEDPEAQQYLQDLQTWWMSEGAYSMLQSTKPQTLAYGLNDSPVGLAAWIVEKFRKWSDCDGDIETRFTKDELLTNVMIYWVTQTIGSAVRLYRETDQDTPLYPAPRIEVPVGIAHFPIDLIPPRQWVEHDMNVQRWTKMPRGGHFAALEEPELFVEELRAFFRPLR